MSAQTMSCSSLHCHRLALFRCLGCGRALCERHAVRLPSFGRAAWVCAACQRRYYTDPKRRLTRLPFSQT